MDTLNFSQFPVFTTNRLTLRQLTKDDKQNIFALRSDPQINKYLEREPSNSIEDAISFIKKVDNNIKNNNSIYWIISLTTTKTVVGTICLYDFSIEKNSCEIGYELMTSFQGQGIMTEAAEVVIKYAFQILKLQKIVAFTHIENMNSIKLLTKFNFIQSKEADKENPNSTIFTLSSHRLI